MYDLFFQKFRERTPLSIEEEQIISQNLTVRNTEKKELILHAGAHCEHIVFVSSGLLKSYTRDENNEDHIVQFAPEGWFISDLYSFITGEPAQYYIESIEASEIVIIEKAAHQKMLQDCGKYESFMRELITDAYIALQRRLNANITLSVEARYENFIQKYPDISQRVPQRLIASYLGLTPETLSRIRRRLVKP